MKRQWASSRWNEDKGRGFIAVKGGANDVYFHKSGTVLGRAKVRDHHYIHS